jgi:hypothetical protein
VVLSNEVLEAIDAVVGKRGRSRFFEEAAKEKLERLALAEGARGDCRNRSRPPVPAVGRPASGGGLGEEAASPGVASMTLYPLDTAVLIAIFAVTLPDALRDHLAGNHSLGRVASTSPKSREAVGRRSGKAVTMRLSRLQFLGSSRR